MNLSVKVYTRFQKISIHKKKSFLFFVKHNVRQVKFVDRTFNANKKHFIPILSYLAAQKCRTNFHFEIINLSSLVD